MPEREVLERVQKDKDQGKSPSTQAGEFVREEMHHIREGKHGARSPQQAVAIGLSKARRAGVPLPSPRKGRVSEKTRKQARRESKNAKRSKSRQPSRARSRATLNALRHEGRSAASTQSLSNFARGTAQRRGSRSLRRSAKKAARTRRKEKTT